MVILRMQATFGCLDGAVLELSDGLNCLVLPNGAGKSTWAAFLTAMFYGVDPAARKSRGRLPVRLQFAPWSGKPMAGIVHLKLEEREIVLERSSAARPMDTFRAYDPVTGQAVAGLTGDNCGQVLWGVEREVFLRTAMIGGDLSVTADQALLQRLQNLASTGRESDSARAAAETLKAWKNRCRYHNTGLLPETEAAISRTKAALSRAEAAAAAQRKGVQALEQAEESAKLRRAALEREIAAARTAARAAAQAAEHDPPLETLLKLDAQASRLPGGAAGAGNPPRAPAPLGASPGRRRIGAGGGGGAAGRPKARAGGWSRHCGAVSPLVGRGRSGAPPEEPKDAPGHLKSVAGGRRGGAFAPGRGLPGRPPPGLGGGSALRGGARFRARGQDAHPGAHGHCPSPGAPAGIGARPGSAFGGGAPPGRRRR